MPTSKRQKVEDLEKDPNVSINRSTEVEDILSGKVLDTDIPGLEELMSTESKYRFETLIASILFLPLLLVPMNTIYISKFCNK